MAEDNIEIEIQVNVEKSEKLLNFLQKNAEFKYETHQKDEYFTPAHKNYLEQRPVKEWLRLRGSDGKYFITYKNWHYLENGESTHADEYETEVKDLETLRKIFSALDCKRLITVNKHRKVWRYKDYEIAVDKIKGLGDFVEVEYYGKEFLDPKRINKEMLEFLKGLDCGEIKMNFVGYPFLLLFPDEVEYKIH